jgi:hypothetical protein
MPQTKTFKRFALPAAILLCIATAISAQTLNDFSGRLSWVPVSPQLRSQVGGEGTMTARLARSQLTISGSYADLPAAAVSASLREGAATGARGPVIAELSISGDTRGSISGELRLQRSQISALREGRLYVQLHGESGIEPDNAILWGWLLPEDQTR